MVDFSALSPQEVLSLAIRVEYANAGRFKVLADQFEAYEEALCALFLRLWDEELIHADKLNSAWSTQFENAPKPRISEDQVNVVIESVEVEHGEHGVFDDIEVDDAIRMVRRSEVQARDQGQGHFRADQ